MKKKTICLYHAECSDGFAAAWAVRHALGETDVEYFAAEYGKPPLDVTGRRVILVDFSYKRPMIESMASVVENILILDHHRTAAADLSGFHIPTGPWHDIPNCHYRVNAIFDMDRCGAMIAWEYFNRGLKPPEFLRYIQDRDLWTKQLPGTDEFSMALRSYPMDFKTWDCLIDSGPIQLIVDGRPILRYYKARVEEVKKTAYRAYLIPKDGDLAVSGMFANAPHFMASEVAGELCADDVSYGATFCEEEPNRWVYSLRSRSDFDVSHLAQQFGGGGHARAAGFVTSTPVHIR